MHCILLSAFNIVCDTLNIIMDNMLGVDNVLKSAQAWIDMSFHGWVLTNLEIVLH